LEKGLHEENNNNKKMGISKNKTPIGVGIMFFEMRV
jgi:hypothetical protein